MRDAKARAKKEIVGLIYGRKKELGLSIQDLVLTARIKRATFYDKMKDPETLTLGEIWRLEDAMHLERGTIGGIK